MSKDKNIPEHLMVKNPYNNKLVNVLPLFKLLDEGISDCEGSLSNIIGVVQEIHDFTSSQVYLMPHSTIESQFDNLIEVNYRLIQLRKMFEGMMEYKA